MGNQESRLAQAFADIAAIAILQERKIADARRRRADHPARPEQSRAHRAGQGIMAAKRDLTHGIGTQSAAQLLVTAGDNPDRLDDEGSFAHLCGVAPLPATSGQRQDRHRLNVGGDRLANAALHMIALNRLRTEKRTQTYMTKKTREGKIQPRDHALPEALHRPRSVRREVFTSVVLELASPVEVQVRRADAVAS